MPTLTIEDFFCSRSELFCRSKQIEEMLIGKFKSQKKKRRGLVDE